MDVHSVENKVSFVFFITGFIIAIMSPFIPFMFYSSTLQTFVLLLVGLFAGIFNVTKEDQKDFLISSTLYVIVIANIGNLVDVNSIPYVFEILRNIAVFFIPGALIATLSLSFEHIHIRHNKKLVHMNVSAETAWNFIVLLGVVMVFFQLILEFFFNTLGYEAILTTIDVLTFIIFSADLVVLYNQRDNLKDFLKTCWLDIIAVIPFSQFARVTKLFRAVRILRGVSKLSKYTKVSKLNKGLKLFSEKSSFNDYLKTNKPDK